MPWQETSPMTQRVQFISDYQRAIFSVTELAARFRISRKTAYKWIDRYDATGPAGLVDQSRRPRGCSHATPTSIVDALLDARRHHPTWGAKKLLRILSRKHPAGNGTPGARAATCSRAMGWCPASAVASFPGIPVAH